eukprot:92-Pelagococcus_subviridis.AAC.2
MTLGLTALEDAVARAAARRCAEATYPASAAESSAQNRGGSGDDGGFRDDENAAAAASSSSYSDDDDDDPPGSVFFSAAARRAASRSAYVFGGLNGAAAGGFNAGTSGRFTLSAGGFVGLNGAHDAAADRASGSGSGSGSGPIPDAADISSETFRSIASNASTLSRSSSAMAGAATADATARSIACAAERFFPHQFDCSSPSSFSSSANESRKRLLFASRNAGGVVVAPKLAPLEPAAAPAPSSSPRLRRSAAAAAASRILSRICCRLISSSSSSSSSSSPSFHTGGDGGGASAGAGSGSGSGAGSGSTSRLSLTDSARRGSTTSSSSSSSSSLSIAILAATAAATALDADPAFDRIDGVDARDAPADPFPCSDSGVNVDGKCARIHRLASMAFSPPACTGLKLVNPRGGSFSLSFSLSLSLSFSISSSRRVAWYAASSASAAAGARIIAGFRILSTRLFSRCGGFSTSDNTNGRCESSTSDIISRRSVSVSIAPRSAAAFALSIFHGADGDGVVAADRARFPSSSPPPPPPPPPAIRLSLKNLLSSLAVVAPSYGLAPAPSPVLPDGVTRVPNAVAACGAGILRPSHAPHARVGAGDRPCFVLAEGVSLWNTLTSLGGGGGSGDLWMYAADRSRASRRSFSRFFACDGSGEGAAVGGGESRITKKTEWTAARTTGREGNVARFAPSPPRAPLSPWPSSRRARAGASSRARAGASRVRARPTSRRPRRISSKSQNDSAAGKRPPLTRAGTTAR